MDTTEQGKKILKDTESRLQQLLAESVKEGKYEVVSLLASWAEAIHSMAEGTAPLRRHIMRGGEDKALLQSSADDHGKSSPASAGKKDYPKFHREGDNLVKVSWSKKKKKPYRHRVPKRIAELVTDRIAEVGEGGRLFMTDELIPIHDGSTGADLPSYQVYLVLSWLNMNRLVEKHGRQGYTVKATKGLASAFADPWCATAQKR